MFLGLCGYYCRYIKNFAAHAAPLHELTKNDTPFIRDNRRQSGFDGLKRILTSAPTLAMSQDTGSFVLDVDASDLAVSAVLQKKRRACCVSLDIQAVS